jgi:hypothetical protein
MKNSDFYFEMLKAHFASKRLAIESIKDHPRIQKQSFCDLAFEEALFEGMQDFLSSKPIVFDVIQNKTGKPTPEVIFAPCAMLHDILNHYPVYQCSLFEDNKLDSVMFQVLFKDDQDQPDRFMIYPLNSLDDIQSLPDKMSKDMGRPVEIYPLFIREAGTFTWKPYLSDLKD